MINKVIQSFCFLVLVGIYITGAMPNNMDDTFMQQVLVIDLVSLISFLFIRHEGSPLLKKQYIRIIYLFLTSFVIVHFQAYIDYLIGNLGSKNYFLWIDNKVVCKSLVISSMGLVSYLMGYSFNEKIVNVVKDNKPLYLNVRILNILATCLLGLFFLTVNKDYLGGQYGNTDEGGIAGNAAFVFEAAIYAIIIVKCRNLVIIKRRTLTFIQYLKYHSYTLFLLAIYLTAVMFSGDRGPIIYCGLAFVFGFIYVARQKIALPKIAFFLLCGALFITFLGVVRRQDRSQGFFSNVTDATGTPDDNNYYPVSFSDGTKELAESVRTLHIAVSKVPTTYPHFYGLFFLQDAMLFVPMLKSAFIKILSLPRPFTSSAEFLTWANMGAFYTWGVGSSCVADTYLDFGFTGIIIVFFIFGYLTRRIELVAFSKVLPPTYLLIIVFIVFSFSVYISRSTILYSMSKFTYVWCFCYLPVFLKKNEA